MATKLVRQRGVLHLIAVIPLSLFLCILFDPKLWGALAGVVLIVSTAARARRWWFNLVSLALAALLAYSAGYRIEFMTNPEGGFFYLAQWSWLITLGWIIAVSQGVAVLGQLDPSGRLLTKILVISGSALVLISLWQGQLFGVMILLALLALALGLRSVPTERWSRAVGYGLALAAIVGLVKATASVALLAPLIALGLPFTGTLSIVYSHRLHLWRERPWMLSLLYLCSAYVSVLAFLATRLELTVLAWVGGATAAGAGLLAWALLRLPQTAVTAKKFVLFGTPIDCVTLDEAVQKIESYLTLALSVNGEGRSEGAPALVCTPDTTAILRAQRDPHLRAVYERADLVTPDGTGIVWAARLLGAPVPERVSGIDLLEKFFASRRAPLRVFLLGAAPGVAEQAAHKLTERYPALQIVGTHHGYFGEDDRVVHLINHAQPDVVLVGLGVPRQELWMHQNRRRLKTAVLMGVGGCFDVWAGALKRAPRSWQRLGLEWLYRLWQEPRRLVRASAIPIFLGQISLVKIARAFSD
jgi:N-acetylglucosaminyldiphosphoundecaprenol N-acetyl-beta-D-mannosaminyltransferase